MKRITQFTAIALSALLFASCADMFQDRVEMKKDTNGVNLGSMFSKNKTKDKLDPPKQIFVTSGEHKDKVVVTWEKVQDARSYRLERAVSSEKDENGEWKIPEEGAFETLPHSTFISGESFTDTIIDNTPANVLDYTNEAYNCAYFYRVSAENKIDKLEESDWYPNYYPEAEEGKVAPKPTTLAIGTLLTPPSNTKASCGKYQEKIELKWTSAPGSISSYRIFRSTASDGSGASQIATVYGNATSYEFEVLPEQRGLNYYFTLVSVDSRGNESVTSPIAMGYALKPGAPGMPTNVKVSQGQGRGETKANIRIEWEAGSGAEKYQVYRFTSSDSTLKIVGENVTDLFFDDTSTLKPNLFYYYQVQSISTMTGEELFSAMSESGDDSDDPAEGFIVSPPQSVAVKKILGDTSNCKIVFSAAIGSQDCSNNTAITKKKADWKTYDYCFYGGDSVTGAFTQITGVTFTKSSEEGMYEAQVPSTALIKFYKVATKNGTVESEPTAAYAPAPYAAQNLVATKNAALAGYTDIVDNSKANFPSEPQANANGVHAIKLTWQAPTGGADGGYNIYRSTKPNSGFKKINESPITETSYIYKDEQAKAGNYYYYRILSLNSLGQGANYSNTDYGYGALTTYQYVREYIKTTLNSQKKLTLMHKSGATDKLGSDESKGDISGNLTYNASIAGLGGRVIMHYTNYADYYIMNDKSLGVYFLLNGNTNTSASMDTNGTMDGTVTIQGMYPGSVVYDNIKIKGGAAGGGTYGVTRTGIDSSAVQADWTWGEK